MKTFALIVSMITATGFQLAVSNAVFGGQQKVESVVGVVADIDKDSKSATLKTDSGEVIKLKTDDSTVCLRIPAGEKTLNKAAPIQFADVAVGDRVLGHGTKTDQGFVAQRLVVMPVAEVARKREHDLEEWKRRGVGGIVRDVNAQTGEIALELRSAGAGGRIVIETAKAKFRRYVPGSLRFEDAQASSFADIKVGDQLRALGDKSADARAFVAEQIVSGAFKTIGVTVAEVDQQKGEIRAATLDQKRPILIILNKDSVLHRIAPPVAAAIAQRAKAEAGKTATPQPASGQKPAGQPLIDVQQLIDTLPGVSLADFKPGDVLAVTGAVEKDESHLVAIKLAAGVDLVLKALAPAPGKPQVVRLSAGLPTVFDFSVIPIN
jgi:hypothetical protein